MGKIRKESKNFRYVETILCCFRVNVGKVYSRCASNTLKQSRLGYVLQTTYKHKQNSKTCMVLIKINDIYVRTFNNTLLYCLSFYIDESTNFLIKIQTVNDVGIASSSVPVFLGTLPTKKASLNTAAIVGIIIGAVLLSTITGIFVFCVRRRIQAGKQNNAPMVITYDRFSSSKYNFRGHAFIKKCFKGNILPCLLQSPEFTPFAVLRSLYFRNDMFRSVLTFLIIK